MIKKPFWLLLPICCVVGAVGVSEASALHYDRWQSACHVSLEPYENMYTFKGTHNAPGSCARSLDDGMMLLYPAPGSSGSFTVEVPRMIFDSIDANCDDRPFDVTVIRGQQVAVPAWDADVLRHVEYSETANAKFRTLAFEIPDAYLQKVDPDSDRARYKVMILFKGTPYSAEQYGCHKQLMPEYSPAEQIRYGKHPLNIICASERELAFNRNGDPVCVYASSIAELDRRGYLDKTPPVVVFILEKEEYQLSDSIKIVMKNVGERVLRTSHSPVSFSIYDQDGNLACSRDMFFGAEDSLLPGGIIIETWELSTNPCSGNMAAGTYEIRADHFASFNHREMPVHKFTILPDH